MKKRNQRLAIIFFILLAVNLGFLFPGNKSNGVSFKENLFTLEDTASVESFIMATDRSEISVDRMGNGWILNDTHQADESLRRLLMSIMQRVRVKKPVDVEIPEQTTKVSLIGEKPLSFDVWGNATKTKTYFKLDGREQVYEVEIPGYRDYLGQIFELNEDQWRDRLVFSGSWRTIQELTLDYLASDESDFTIRFDDSFFKVNQLIGIDSTVVVDYLNQFQYFEVNEWISEGRFARYDSLSRKPPLASLSIVSINYDEPVLFDIYPQLEGDAFHLVSDQNNNLMVIDQRRIQKVLRKRADFKGG